MNDARMILRTWKARTRPEKLPDYLQQVEAVVIPHLRAQIGFAGAEFAQRALDDGRVEILVITRWQSAAAVAAFAQGATAWLPDEIAATLLNFDSESVHYERLVAVD
ncbi:MAG: antibiotic biosynthesis monooxygenase [Wenzhouxiangellaceae bacterium]